MTKQGVAIQLTDFATKVEGMGSRERIGSDDDIKIVLDDREDDGPSPMTRNIANTGKGAGSTTIKSKRDISKRLNNQSMNLITMSKIDS